MRGGLVSMRHWVKCLACGASTALLDGHMAAAQAWRDGQRSKPAQHPHGCICPAGAEATCQGALCPRRPLSTRSAIA